MRLVSYGAAGSERAGLLRQDGILDLEQAMRASGLAAPVSDMRLFLEQPDWKASLQAIDRLGAAPAPIDQSSARLGPPVPVPRKLMIAGANTFSHLKEAAPLLGKVDPPKDPMILGKATSSIAGPF